MPLPIEPLAVLCECTLVVSLREYVRMRDSDSMMVTPACWPEVLICATY